MTFIKKIKQFIGVSEPVKPMVLTFTGGMGAQIINAAIYFLEKESGRPVYADFSYYKSPEKVATVGIKGECSHWPWQLDLFGLPMTSFEVVPNHYKNTDILQDDDVRKSELSLKALVRPEIARYFKIPEGVKDILGDHCEQYLCMHVRRGDYVNVASHLVQDSEFLALANKFSGLVSRAVILSDSPIEAEFQHSISSLFQHVYFLDNTDVFTAHRIMRNARILICSNSQFSLTSALLNPNALVIIPIQWFGGGHRALEAPLNSTCSFQIMGGHH